MTDEPDWGDGYYPTPCKHLDGWVTDHITPYYTVICCPDCGEKQTIRDQ